MKKRKSNAPIYLGGAAIGGATGYKGLYYLTKSNAKNKQKKLLKLKNYLEKTGEYRTASGSLSSRYKGVVRKSKTAAAKVRMLQGKTGKLVKLAGLGSGIAAGIVAASHIAERRRNG